MKQIKDELKQLKQEVNNRKHKRMTIKMRSFLNRLGHKRRSETLIKEVTYWLDKYELVAYTSKKVPWHQVKMDQWLTFSEVKTDLFVREVTIKQAASSIKLYVHQEQALSTLNKRMHERFSGLVSIPTGGGKTVVAVHWLLTHGLNRKRKVLWLAHRHDLLEQAYRSIETLATDKLIKQRRSFNCRLISGHAEHDSITQIKSTDDIIIATSMSLANTVDLFINQWLEEDAEVLVIVDEAHHATAKTYQTILKGLRLHAKPKTLGLTATPFRTVEEEKGLLKQCFRDDLIYKIDLRTLIARGILADPYFKEVQTDVGKSIDLTSLEQEQINQFDRLPDRVATHLIEQKKRNETIVNEYYTNRVRYGKTIVFAINRKHAVLLSVMFRAKGVRADYLISQDKETNERRDQLLHMFRTNQLDVLINVNMLTEGTDLPDVQAVLLARPTTSAILMTQMVGRALRGVEAGGTSTAFIVYFQDNWQENLTWVLPETLYPDESATQKPSFVKKDKGEKTYSISLAQFEQLFKQIPTTEHMENRAYIESVPVGVYSFTEPNNQKGETTDILVYQALEESYRSFVDSLPFVGSELTAHQFIWEMEKTHFKGRTNEFGYRREDIELIYSYYIAKGKRPIFRFFKDRHKVDLTLMAKKISEEVLIGQAKIEYINQCWNAEAGFLPIYFGFNKLAFRKRLEVELLKLEEPELFMEKKNPVD